LVEMLLGNYGGVEVDARAAQFGFGVILVLAGPRIVERVMLHAQKGQVVLHAVRRILVDVSDLAKLLRQVAKQVVAERTTPRTLYQNLSLDVGRSCRPFTHHLKDGTDFLSGSRQNSTACNASLFINNQTLDRISTIPIMLIVPLDAVEPVKQVVPQVLVTVQQPVGMPEWEKILLSACVGAMFALAGSLVSELVKPWIQKRHSRRVMVQQLNDELLSNMGHVELARQMMAEDAPNVKMAALVLSGLVTHDRFDYFFEEEKTLVYEHDKNLVAFYSIVTKSIQQALTLPGEHSVDKIVIAAITLADKHLKDHELHYSSE
jgi:hypothetical protein